MPRPTDTDRYELTDAEENDLQYDFVFVDQNSFEKHAPKIFAALATTFTDYHL